MNALDRPSAEIDLELAVNGALLRRTVPARLLLLDLLRDELGLTGTHAGCEHGICGACTVLIDGQPSRSCTTLVGQVEGAEITTVEGLTPEQGLSPMQEAFRECHGLQCGYCTPGFLVTLAGVDPGQYPDDESIRELLAGNLCRCTGYTQIIDAVRAGWGREPRDGDR